MLFNAKENSVYLKRFQLVIVLILEFGNGKTPPEISESAAECLTAYGIDLCSFCCS